MLLRRMMSHVTNQNWFAVALDFGIVVGGVLLAFQLQTWGQDREAEERAQLSLRQLFDESQVVLDNITGMARYHDGLLQRQDQVVAALHTGEQGGIPDDVLAQSLQFMNFFVSINPPRRVYDELNNAGLLREIDAPEALAAISTYYEDLAFIQNQIEFFRPERDEGLWPYAGRGINNHYETGNAQRLRIEVEFDRLANDPQFLSDIAGLHRARLTFENYRRRLLASAARMCLTLAEAIDGTCAGHAAAEPFFDTPDWIEANAPSEEETHQ